MTNKIRAIGAALLVGLWLVLTGFAWFMPNQIYSFSERSYLDRFPELSVENILEEGNESFMSEFNSYTLDQFPLRDTFRQLKALFHLYGLQQKDNNDLYIHNGYIAEMAVLDEKCFGANLTSIQRIYERYIKPAQEAGSTGKVYMGIIPDKNYFLAQDSGHLSLDYDKMFADVQTAAPWAAHVDLTDVLEISNYYYTDTHWRQEKLLDVAQKLAAAMGVDGPREEDFTCEKLEAPFLGVYYGQIALPVPSEDIYILRNEMLDNCLVSYDGAEPVKGVYDMDRAQLKVETLPNGKTQVYSDLYEVFLSKESGKLVIENPNAKTHKELIVFRDSFGRSLLPLLVQDYAKITAVDTRWIGGGTYMLQNQGIDFTNADVLFLYSTLALNAQNLK